MLNKIFNLLFQQLRCRARRAERTPSAETDIGGEAGEGKNSTEDEDEETLEQTTTQECPEMTEASLELLENPTVGSHHHCQALGQQPPPQTLQVQYQGMKPLTQCVQGHQAQQQYILLRQGQHQLSPMFSNLPPDGQIVSSEASTRQYEACK